MQQTDKDRQTERRGKERKENQLTILDKCDFFPQKDTSLVSITTKILLGQTGGQTPYLSRISVLECNLWH